MGRPNGIGSVGDVAEGDWAEGLARSGARLRAQGFGGGDGEGAEDVSVRYNSAGDQSGAQSVEHVIGQQGFLAWAAKNLPGVRVFESSFTLDERTTTTVPLNEHAGVYLYGERVNSVGGSSLWRYSAPLPQPGRGDWLEIQRSYQSQPSIPDPVDGSYANRVGVGTYIDLFKVRGTTISLCPEAGVEFMHQMTPGGGSYNTNSFYIMVGICAR